MDDVGGTPPNTATAGVAAPDTTDDVGGTPPNTAAAGVTLPPRTGDDGMDDGREESISPPGDSRAMGGGAREVVNTGRSHVVCFVFEL